MLKIINNLKPFIEDNYRLVNIREYARIQKVTPPTASRILSSFHKEGLLKKENNKQYIYYYADKESPLFIDLSRIYWKISLQRSDIINLIEEEFLNPVIILFGSLSKAEAKQDSDIDLAVFSITKKEVRLEKYEKKLKRKIQLMLFQKRDDVKNTELLNNILNGYIIAGSW
jgi:predicted nucleotidyltransferase